MPRWREHQRLWVSLSAVLLLITYAVCWETPHFATNDDSAIMLFVSGQVLSLEPTAFAIFMNLFLCRVLVTLYRWSGQVPWYGLMHLAGLTAGVVATLYALYLKEATLRQLGLFFAWFIAIVLPYVIRMQFTTTACVVCLGGLSLLDVGLTQYGSRRATAAQTWRRLIAAVFLLSFAFAIRSESVSLVLIIAGPLLLSLAWRTVEAQAYILLLAMPLCIGTVVLALHIGHQHGYAHDPEWQRFYQLLWVKSEFLDYRHVTYTPESREYFQAVGWSENDYRMLMRWFYVDPVHYSIDRFQTLIAHFPVAPPSSLQILRTLEALCTMLRSDGILLVALPLLLGTAFLSVGRGRSTLIVLATVLDAVVVLSILLLFFKLPDRVYQTVLITTCWVALFLSEENVSDSLHPRLRTFSRIGGLLCTGVTLWLTVVHPHAPLQRVRGWGQERERLNRDLRLSLAQLAPHPSQTFVGWGTTFPYEAILPLEGTVYLHGLRIIGLGASNQSPLQKRMLAAQGIRDLFRAMYERDDIFISMRADAAQCAQDKTILTTYFAEHYGVQVDMIPSFDAAPLRFWQVHRVAALQ